MSTTEDCCGAYTTRGIEKCSFYWTLEMFSHLGDRSRRSPVFRAVDSKFQCMLELHPRELKDEQAYIGLYLICFNEIKPYESDILVSCKFSLLNSKGILILERSMENVQVDNRGRGVGNFIEVNRLLQILSDDILKIRADVTMFLPVATTSIEIKRSTEKPRNLISSLLESKNFSDFVINVQGTQIPVHRCILSICSPVFKAMLLSDTSEAKLGRMDIEDMELTTVRSMIEFFYTVKVSSLDVPLAINLLRAADKYDVPDLATHCSKYLQENLCASHVIEILESALYLNATELKVSCLKFIKRNRHVVELVDSLKKQLGEGKDWALEIILKM